MKRPLIIIGAGGHARVLLDTLLNQSNKIIGITNPDPNKFGHYISDIPIIGNDDLILNYCPNSIYLINGIGMMPGKSTRYQLYEKFKNHGYTFTKIIHPSAVLASNVQLLAGVQVMAGVIIQTSVVIDENSIINTRVAIDHDSFIGKHVHLAPGVTVSGGVSIGEGTFVGAGSTIIQGIKIAAHCIIGAGSVVTRDIPEVSTVMGIPARVIKNA